MVRAFLLVTVTMMMVSACDPTRVYEQYAELPSAWAATDTINFQVIIEDSDTPYNITTQFRCDISYPYNNLYYYLRISDDQAVEKYSDLHEVLFFEKKTGKPLGSGLGDLYHIEQQALQGYKFPLADTFNIQLIQYMRLDTLSGIDQAGLRVNRQLSE